MDAPLYVTPVKKEKKRRWFYYFKKKQKTLLNASYKSVKLILYHKTHVLDQIPLSTKNVAVYYVMLTIHESNAPLPVTRHQFRMMRDKDILQLFFEELN